MGHLKSSQAATDRILSLLKVRGVIRPRDLDAYGIPRRYLSRLYERGILLRSSRGIYMAVDAELSEKQTIVEVCKRIPKGTVCLLSALGMHELTTQAPYEVWLAIDRKDWLPQVKDLPVRIVRFSGDALKSGIEHHTIDGFSIPVYNPAKTVVDCFKYRNKIGLDVAIEALKDGWKVNRFTMNEIQKYADICRVHNVMKPYLETLVA
ncbi:MAG: transcriptional regulator [Zetaproteobacteria bacterium CG2_30_46_52]|nr:MAG: transcriptional regulator [Zetaproteobacteria bacterium CG2_30_46_52]